MKQQLTLMALLVCLTAAPALTQTSIFDGHYAVIGGYGPDCLTTGDVNGDGHADLVFASGSDDAVGIAFSNGNGTFLPPVFYAIGVNIYSVALAPINTDTHLDLLVGSDNEDLRVFLNDGAGTFVYDTAYDVGSDAQAIAWADFDHDLDFDVTVVVYDGIVVLYNDGGGRFAQVSPTPCGGGGNMDIAAIDQDGDTYADIVMCAYGRDTIYTFRNNHVTGFDAPVAYYAGDHALRMVVGYFNSDPYPDVAAICRYENAVAVRFGQIGGTLGGRMLYSVPTGPYCITNGDFDNDGYQDLAVACFAAEQLVILRNNQDGTFTLARTFSNPLTYSITTGQMNDDTNLDLIATFDDQYCRVMFGDGACDFPTAGSHSSERGCYDFAVGDIDGDDDSDIVFTNRSTGSINVIRGIGNAAFGPPGMTILSDMEPADMILVDIDNANGPDVVFVDDTKDSLGLMLNNGGGAFPSVTYVPTGDSPGKPIAAHFNSDAFLDLAVPNENGNSVSVFLNNQDGTFDTGVEYPVVDETRSVAAVDYDGDLDQDLVVAVRGWPDYRIALYENDGTGSFTAGATLPVDLAPTYVNGIDLENDGDEDLIVGVDGDSLYVYLNDGAGNYSGPDIYDMPYYCYDPKFADLDQDGDQDIIIHHGGYYYFTVVGNDGDGTLAPPMTWFYGDVLADVEIGDFDGDTYLDIAAMPAEYCYDSLMLIYLNQTGLIPTGFVDDERPGTLPNTFALSAWPNPFNPVQTVSFTLPRRAQVSLDVINVLGQKVRTLIDCELPSGETRVAWDGRNDARQPVASGVYFYHLVAGDRAQSLKTALVR